SQAGWDGAAAAHARAYALRLEAEELIELDALAYNAFVDAVRSGNDVTGARRRTIEVPKAIAMVAAGVFALARELERAGNPNLQAAAVAAATFALAAADIAEMLMRVNESAGRRPAPARA